MINTLFFVTGGYSTAEISHVIMMKESPNRSEKHKDWQNGWTIGLGSVYYFFYKNLSANLEYRYTDFGTNNVNMWQCGTMHLNLKKFSQDEVTFGITYHF